MDHLKSHIHLSTLNINGFPEMQFDGADIEIEGLDITMERRGIEMWAGLEWLKPSSVFINISKAYFDGFLKEAGKAHFIILKDWIIKMLGRGKEIENKVLSKNVSGTKLPEQFPNIFSFYIQLPNNSRIKVMPDRTIAIEVYEKKLRELLDNILEAYEMVDRINSERKGQSAPLQIQPYSNCVAILNKSNLEWDFLSDMELARISRTGNNHS